MEKYIVDTNILLDYPQIIDIKDVEIIIPTCVLRELDGLKRNQNNDTAFNARRAAVCISRNMDSVSFYDSDNLNIPVDDQLLVIAQDKNATLVTNDVYLKVKAQIKGINTKGYSHSDDYDGVNYWYLKNKDCEEEFTKIYETGDVPEQLGLLYENQYIIAKDLDSPCINNNFKEDYETYGELVYRDGKLRGIKNPQIKNKYINCIVPRNSEQACLFDILNNKNITVAYAGGKFGTGKSFILNNFALQELEKGNIQKIVYVPNNSFVENTMDIGALPGELLTKIEGQIGPLIDLVGIDRVQDMLQNEELEIVPMGFIRGRSFQNSILIINEAQNLTEDHVKLLIARCGEGTRIFFDGDIKQADSQLFRNKNGLKLLLGLRKSPTYSKMFATIKLTMTERSKTAQCAEFLDDLSSKM